jgi:hypothetical protein
MSKQYASQRKEFENRLDMLKKEADAVLESLEMSISGQGGPTHHLMISISLLILMMTLTICPNQSAYPKMKYEMVLLISMRSTGYYSSVLVTEY